MIDEGYAFTQESLDSVEVTDKVLIDEVWMSIFVNDVQIGYSRTTTYKCKYEGINAYENNSENIIRAKIRGYRYVAVSRAQIIVDEDYNPLYFKTIGGSGRYRTSTVGKKKDNVILTRRESAWTSSEGKIDLEQDVYFATDILKVIRNKGVEQAKEYKIKVLDTEDLQIEEWTVKLLERHRVKPSKEIISQKVKGDVWFERWLIAGNIVKYWVDDNNNVLRREEVDRVTVRTTKEEALDFAPTLDILESNAFKCNTLIINSKKVNQLKLRLKIRGIACDQIFEQDDRLKLLKSNKKGDTCVVVISSIVPAFNDTDAVTLPIDKEGFAPYLAVTPYIQADDTTIINLAKQIVGDETNAYRAATRIAEWVHQNVRYQFFFANVTALDVLKTRRGDCTEYALLYTALARAAGIPTRNCVGIVYGSDGKFYRHAWAESWVGRWVAIDPTWGEHIADATHLKFGEMYAQLPKEITPDAIQVMDYAIYTPEGELWMSEIGLNLDFDYNQTLAKEFNPLNKEIAKLRNESQYGELNLDEIKEVRKQLTGFVSKYPKSISAIRARHAIAETYFFEGNYERAVQEMTNFVNRYSYLDYELNSTALQRIGQSYLRMKQYEEALDAFKRIKEEYPESQVIADMVVDVEEIAHHYWNMGRYDEAISQYKEMAKLFPNRKIIYQERLADIWASEGNYNKAIEQYNHLIELYPYRKTIYNEQIALLYRRVGRYDAAIDKFKELMGLYPDRKLIYEEQIAEIYKAQGKHEDAIAKYKELAKRYPDRKVIYNEQIVKVYVIQGNYDKAIAQYERLAKLFSERKVIYYEKIADVYERQLKYDEAIKQYEHLARLFSDRKLIYYEQIARVYELQGNYDKAIKQYEKLIRLYPERKNIYSKRISKILGNK